MHRVLRPGLRSLVGTGVTPDMLTAARLLTGIVAALLIGSGRSGAQDAGGAVFLLSMLLDRADGELARLSGRFSRFGGRLDVVADCLATALCFAALGFGFRPGWLPPAAGWGLGIAAGGGIVALFVRLGAMPPALGGLGPGAVPRRWFDPDDSLVLLPVLIWCGAGQLMLWLAALGTPSSAAALWGALWWRGRFRNRSPDRVSRRVAG